MSVLSNQAVLDALRRYPLLDAGQVEELVRDVMPRCADSRALGKELLLREWLTSYQVNLLFQGRAQELMLGQYVLLQRLGAGGMGEVFKARHARLGRLAALKLIRKEHLAHPQAIPRFQREARTAAQLAHPNVVMVYDADQVGDTFFFAMEYVEGTDLSQMLKSQGRLPVGRACDFIRQAALGLQHAHEMGLVHRDIKPGNLVVTKVPGQERELVKILDFGLARMTGEGENANTLTHTGDVLGTPDFIAPEQARNMKTADIRSDIFSLGCSLFCLLTGKAPFPGDTIMEKLSARLMGDKRSLQELCPEAPAELAAVIDRMILPDPAARYQTPADVATALQPFCLLANDTGSMDQPTRVTKPIATPLSHSAEWAETKTFSKSAAGKSGSSRLLLMLGAGVALGALIIVLTGVVMSALLGTRTAPAAKDKDSTAQHDPPDKAANPPKKDKDDWETLVPRALSIRNLQLARRWNQVGDDLLFSFQMAATEAVPVPNEARNKRLVLQIGSFQPMIERLGDDATIAAQEQLGAKRSGRKYLTTGHGLELRNDIFKGQVSDLVATLPTASFPAGKYRYYLEFRDIKDHAFQTISVEFELGPTSPTEWETLVPKSLRIENLQLAGNKYHSGDVVVFQFNMVNSSDQTFLAPIDPKFPDWQFRLGAFQSSFERLGENPTIASVGANVRRVGTRYKPLFPSDMYLKNDIDSKKKNEVQVTLTTTRFPPGKYRYYVELLTLKNRPIPEELHVDFELLP